MNLDVMRRKQRKVEKASSHRQSNPEHLPLSHDSLTTTKPHNPTAQMVLNASVRHLAATQYVPSELHLGRVDRLLAFFTFLYFCLITSKFIYFQLEARCSQHCKSYFLITYIVVKTQHCPQSLQSGKKKPISNYRCNLPSFLLHCSANIYVLLCINTVICSLLLCLLFYQFFRVHIMVEVEKIISPLAWGFCCEVICNIMWDPPLDVNLEQDGYLSGVRVPWDWANNGA